MKIQQARAISQEKLGGDYQVLVLEAPAIGAAAAPGQFVHVRIPRRAEFTLRRPFSVFRADDRTLSILYKRVGRGTEAMTELRAGDKVDLLGPLGNGFPLDTAGAFPVIVAGGYGIAPLCFLARRLAAPGLALVGGASADDILCLDEFGEAGWQVRVATEDGSRGEKGLVTAVLDSWLQEQAGKEDPVCFACGPDAMLKAVGDRAMAGGWKAWLSLEKRMGCGVGVCLACVQKVRGEDGTETWARVCRDGPVFESREVVWP